jgi:putative oxidoreductase
MPLHDNLDMAAAGEQPRTMNSLKRFADPVYCIMRLIVGLLFAEHGAQKILGWFPPPGKPPQALDALGLIGGWIELGGGVLIAIGLLTSIVALIASGEMAVAFFMSHFHAGGTGWVPLVNGGEKAVFYCFVFLFMFFYGSGRLSVDAMIRKPDTATPAAT